MATTIINNFIQDRDANRYINAVEVADGQPLEDGVKTAIRIFIRDCKKDNVWGSIKASCILAGARTLAGALVPLVGTAPTNFNFVAEDYNRKTGLKGNGSTKYLNSNRAGNVDPQNNKHVSIYTTNYGTNNKIYLGDGGYYIKGNTVLYIGSTSRFGGRVSHPANLERSDLSLSSLVPSVFAPYFLGLNRNQGNSQSLRGGGITVSNSIASVAPTPQTTCIFTNNISEAFSDARLSFYSIGESLDLAKLDTSVTTLMNTLNSAIP